MPSKILVCMFYYPDQSSVDGWAGPVLRAIGYHKNPARVERLIRKAFQEAIATIQIPGCPQVIPVPLYQVLDGKSPADYVASVEPSAVGGNKLAEFLLDVIDKASSTTEAPSTGVMQGRS